MAYDPSNTVHTQVAYAVTAVGDPLFTATIQSSDSPDYTAAKVQALSQCQINSPEGVHRVPE